MRTRQYEVIFIVSILFIIFYFITYKTSFDSICGKYTGEKNLSQIDKLSKMWSCKDTYICSNINIEYDELRRNVTNWDCKKNQIDIFEGNFYKNKFYNIKNQINK